MKSLEHNDGTELPNTIKTYNGVENILISQEDGARPKSKTDNRKVYVVMNGQTQYDKDSRSFGFQKSMQQRVNKNQSVTQRKYLDCNEYSHQHEYVLISYRVRWVDNGRTELSDQFLWPKSLRDIKQMKMFAIDYLSDTLGGKNIGKYNPQHVSGKYFNFLMKLTVYF